MAIKKPVFSDLLSYFEEVKPPLIINEETIEHIKDMVKPIPQFLIDRFVSGWEAELDEYTEIVPCFSLTISDECRAIVYWKASLMKYEYVLLTFDKKDALVARKVICGTIVDGDIIKKSVAKIDEDLIVHIQAGATYIDQEFDGLNSQSFDMEILESGDILFHVDDANSTH